MNATSLSRAAAVISALTLAGPSYAGAAPGEATDTVLAAARARNPAAVRTLVRKGGDVNAAQPDGETALHWAAHWDDVGTAEVLLAAGARVNSANSLGATPLWLACANGSAGMANVLLHAGADPNAPLHFGETPLMAAARAGAADVVRLLLASGARPSEGLAGRGQTALMWASAEGHLDVMHALLDGGAKVDESSASGFTPLMFVARHGHVAAARALLDRGASINRQSKEGATALLVAVVRGHVELAEQLLAWGADADLSGTGYTALHWAAGAWETSVTTHEFAEGEWRALRGIPSAAAKARIIKALVAHGANVNRRADKEALRTGYTLIGLKPRLARQGTTPFYLAAMAGDPDTMRLLVSLGADPAIPSVNNTTALLVASGLVRVDHETSITEAQALSAVTLALELGIDVNAANDDGQTALHAAVMAGLDTVVEYLVRRGASLTATTKAGQTPLALAEDGHVFAMQLLKRPSAAALLRRLSATEDQR